MNSALNTKTAQMEKRVLGKVGGEMQRTTPRLAQTCIEKQIRLCGRAVRERKIGVE